MTHQLLFHDLAPDPREEWQRLLRFVGWGEADRLAAARSVEAIFARGHELVVETYAHLAKVPETAALLGWQDGPEPEHLEERRRFLTIWLARTLGLDTSDELAVHLFRAGLVHHGLGSRRVHVPQSYVIATVGLVQAGFARCLAEAGLPADVTAAALGAWSRYLSVQLDVMLLGYRAAADLTDGDVTVRCAAYGRLRELFGDRAVLVGLRRDGSLGEVLGKLFAAYPRVRAEVLDRVWDESEPAASRTVTLTPVYMPRPGWRLLLNGRDASYEGGLDQQVGAGDEVSLFPPGR
ncbi:MAG: protoglobin domain-containing protein [Chloroflexota bacterium]